MSIGLWNAEILNMTLEYDIKVQANNREGNEAKPLSYPIEFPLTEGQQEIWISSQLGAAASCAFNLSKWIKMEGHLDEWVLREAIQTLVNRHEALRITMAADGSSQCVQLELPIDLPSIDMSQHTEAECAASLDALRAEEVETPFDLLHGPLVRFRLIKTLASQHILFLTAHHDICDEWSIGVLLRDLAELYSAQIEGRPPKLVEVTQFSKYATWYGSPPKPRTLS